jgi:diaminopimelate decarboxylase
MSSTELVLPDVTRRISCAYSVRDGRLAVEEVDPVVLAQSIATPFVLVSTRQFTDNASFIGAAFHTEHPSGNLVCSRALPLPTRCTDLLRDDPIVLETDSATEIESFCLQGIPVSQIVACASGGPQTIAAALDLGVDAISLNTAGETALVAAAAASRDLATRCILCLDGELAGGWWARGPAGPHRIAREAISVRLNQVAAHPALKLVGLAVDLGPLVAETDAYHKTAGLLCGLADELGSTHGAVLEFIELSGGMVGEQVVTDGADGEPFGSGTQPARTWGEYARAIHSAIGDRPLGLRIAPGEGLIAGCSALFARLSEARDPDQSDSVRRFSLTGQDWLPPGGAAGAWSAAVVIANRASERHNCAHWLCLRQMRAGAAGAHRHFLRRRLPATTTVGDLVAFLGWGLDGGSVPADSEASATAPQALLVEGDRSYAAGAGWQRRPRW